VLDAALKASNDEKTKALRPLKSKLAELDRRHKELSLSIQNCVEAVKQNGAKSIADEFMEEAENLSREKRRIDLDRTRVQLEINHRENVVADKHVIADALVRFENVLGKLPEEEQKELVRLLIREITVKHFDPNKDQEPTGKGSFSVKIRTKWYLVNMSLFASGLFPETWESGKISSDLKKIGSRGRARNSQAINGRKSELTIANVQA
jgi:hypothetical protein